MFCFISVFNLDLGCGMFRRSLVIVVEFLDLDSICREGFSAFLGLFELVVFILWMVIVVDVIFVLDYGRSLI